MALQRPACALAYIIYYYSKSLYMHKIKVYKLGCSWHTNQYLIQLFIGSSPSSKCRETSLPWDLPLLSVHHKARICKYKINTLHILYLHVFCIRRVGGSLEKKKSTNIEGQEISMFWTSPDHRADLVVRSLPKTLWRRSLNWKLIFQS